MAVAAIFVQHRTAVFGILANLKAAIKGLDLNHSISIHKNFKKSW
jgi:hypothetical protein